MKTQFYPKGGWTAVVFLLLFNCADDSNLAPETASNEKLLNNYLDARSELGSIAPYLYEKVENRYEPFGEIAYNQLKYNLVENPVEFLPESSRKGFEALSREMEKDYGGLALNEMLSKAKQDGILDEPAYVLVSKYFEEVTNKIESASDTEEIWDYLLKYERQLEKNTTSPLAREFLLLSSSMLRNQIKYNFEIDEFSKRAALQMPDARVAGTSCFLGIKTSCWAQQAGLALVAGFAGAVGGIISAVADGIVWSSIVNSGLTTAATTFIKGVASSYASSSCGCGTVLPACTTPTAMRLIIGDCGDTHLWQIVGGGTSPAYFSYTVQNGVFPAFNNSVNIGQTLEKVVSVRQLDMNQNVIVTCVVHCTNGYNYPRANSFNVNAVKNGVNNIVFTGPTYVPVGDIARYHVYGTSQVSNGQLSFTFDRNFAGQRVASGPDYIDIRWTIRLSTYPFGTAYCTVRNNCSGAQGLHNVLVTTY